MIEILFSDLHYTGFSPVRLGDTTWQSKTSPTDALVRRVRPGSGETCSAHRAQPS